MGRRARSTSGTGGREACKYARVTVANASLLKKHMLTQVAGPKRSRVVGLMRHELRLERRCATPMVGVGRLTSEQKAEPTVGIEPGRRLCDADVARSSDDGG